MSTTADRTPVEDLNTYALDVRPKDRDWSEGYGETWEFTAAPCCHSCGEYCRWVDLATLSAEHSTRFVDDVTDPDVTWDAWRCSSPDCERFGDEIEHEDGGPMMSYSYDLPGFEIDLEEAAEAICDLPLCIVTFTDAIDGWSDAHVLALTGGGMDLTWEICEAFMRLGYLPPVHYAANLPGMAGRGGTGSNGKQTLPNARDAWIMAGCRRALKEHIDIATMQAQSGLARLDRIEKGGW